jgi:hypothetical protein
VTTATLRTRGVTIRLKPNSVAEFNQTLEKEILPLLQK